MECGTIWLWNHNFSFNKFHLGPSAFHFSEADLIPCGAAEIDHLAQGYWGNFLIQNVQSSVPLFDWFKIKSAGGLESVFYSRKLSPDCDDGG